MYISINWIKDFVNLEGIDIDNLINRFTLSTAEVEGIIKYGHDINGVVVGKVVSVDKIPDSDKMKVVKVDTGKETVQCVCGAPNVEVGINIPFAPIGSSIQGIEIKTTTMLGMQSNGVCLSEKELGISADHSGLMILDGNIPVGTNIKDVMDIEDTIFEVDNKSLTNRPDLWGHYGIAREIAAITGRPLKELEVEDLELYSNLDKLNVQVEDTDKCYRYSAIAIENISKKISNLNMRIRLFYCGTRAINLLADITNYIMLELGQPMHAFDKSLVDHVNIKTLGVKQQFKTLDEEYREIYEDTLMICKDDEPICIAGIMGGENTEIKENTNSLFLESANFDSTSIRKSATKIGLRTEASTRYEKTLDPELTKLAIARYIKLLKEADADIKIVSCFTDIYVKKYDTVELEISKEYVNKRMGIELTIEKMQQILEALGFKVEVIENNLKVLVPSYRATKDVTMNADLVEEIARIYGYDNIEPKTTIDALKIVKDEETRVNDNIIKNLLSEKYGCNEVHTYVWYDKKKNSSLKIKTEDNIKIINSLNADNNVLRYSMIPSLLCILNDNIKHYNNVNIFEIGRTFEYKNKGENCEEIKTLGLVLATKTSTLKDIMFEAKKMINSICIKTKNVVPEIIEPCNLEYSWVSPVNSGIIKYNDVELGYISVLNLIINDEIDKKSNIVIVEMNLDNILKLNKEDRIYKPITKYQTTNVDLSFIVDKNEKYSTLENYIKQIDTKYLLEYSLVDIFEDEKILKDSKSVTIKFTLGAFDHTLTTEEISKDTNSIIDYFKEKNIELRS